MALLVRELDEFRGMKSMDRREFLNVVAYTAALPAISALPRPALIASGMSRQTALQIFSEHYRRSFATPEVAEFFFPQVKSVSFLLADPLPESQAAALEGVLEGRHGLRAVIDWLCVGRGKSVEEYLPIAEEESQKRQADADADPNRIRFSNEHDCYWFPDGTRGGIFNTPREVVAFYNAYGDPNWRENLEEKPRTPEDEERDRCIEQSGPLFKMRLLPRCHKGAWRTGLDAYSYSCASANLGRFTLGSPHFRGFCDAGDNCCQRVVRLMFKFIRFCMIADTIQSDLYSGRYPAGLYAHFVRASSGHGGYSTLRIDTVTLDRTVAGYHQSLDVGGYTRD